MKFGVKKKEEIFSPVGADDLEEVFQVLQEWDQQKLGYGGIPGNQHGYIFRGEKDYETPLQTRIEREFEKGLAQKEHEYLKHIIERTREYVSQRETSLYPLDNELAEIKPEEEFFWWLSLLQHFGRPTRLLDFTLNPFHALYFALEQGLRDQETDLKIYAFWCQNEQEPGTYDELCNKQPGHKKNQDTPSWLDMNDELRKQIKGKGQEIGPKITISRYFGWDRPFFQNRRIERQQGMFLYPFDPDYEILHKKEEDRNSWLHACFLNTCKIFPNGKEGQVLTIKNSDKLEAQRRLDQKCSRPKPHEISLPEGKPPIPNPPDSPGEILWRIDDFCRT